MQLLYERNDEGENSPILAAVGQLQFEVVQYRLQEEYGVVRSCVCGGVSFVIALVVVRGWWWLAVNDSDPLCILKTHTHKHRRAAWSP